MDKNNIELFKQAISEGLAGRLDKVVNGYTQEIACSQQHSIAMKKIVYEKTDLQKVLSPKMKKIIAILVAATLLLTGCGIIFRNEIREIYIEICDFFTSLTYSYPNSDGKLIEKVYELGYLPNGYTLVDSTISPLTVIYKFENDNNDYIKFEQVVLNGAYFIVNNETGYSQINTIDKYEVFYSSREQNHLYIWNDGTYAFKIHSNTYLSDDEIVSIIEGIIK